MNRVKNGGGGGSFGIISENIGYGGGGCGGVSKEKKQFHINKPEELWICAKQRYGNNNNFVRYAPRLRIDDMTKTKTLFRVKIFGFNFEINKNLS